MIDHIINIKVKDLAKLFLIYGEQLRKPIGDKKTNTKVVVEDSEFEVEFISEGIKINKREKDGNHINS